MPIPLFALRTATTPFAPSIARTFIILAIQESAAIVLESPSAQTAKSAWNARTVSTATLLPIVRTAETALNALSAATAALVGTASAVSDLPANSIACLVSS